MEIYSLYQKCQNRHLTLVLPRGGGRLPTPLTVCLRLHKNAKESDPGHLGHLFYILLSHFDEKTGVPPGADWVLKPAVAKILKRPF